MKIAIVAQGAMGAGVGALLRRGGAAVVTSLDGRSAASAKRAQEAGMTPVSDAELASADMVLSILPPGDALAFASRMAPHLTASASKALFADCNAVSPATVRRVADVIAASGAEFADAGIIGGPPRAGVDGPTFYASGPGAARFARLTDFGLDARALDAPIGAASALKMSYAGITKGITAIGAAMMLAATRADAAQGLRAELADSQPELIAWYERQIPASYAKAYRWIAEMREIASFIGAGTPAADMFENIARFYEQISADEKSTRADVGALEAFLALETRPRPAARLGYKDMLAAAEAEIVTLNAAQAIAMRARDDVALVDLRDPRELEREGAVPGALRCPRGMLEFWIDPDSPYFKPAFAEPKTFVFFCAAGWRSALATQTAQRMGLAKAAHIGGGFKAWKDAGGLVEGGADR